MITDIEYIDEVLKGVMQSIEGQTASGETIEYFALLQIAKGIHRLAAAHEKPVVSSNRGAVHFSVANPEDQPDGQTAQLREIERERTKEG